MFKNLILTWMMAVTLAVGAAPALPASPAVHAPSTAPQFALTAPLAAAARTGAPAVAVQLSRAEMSVVQGAGLFSWVSKLVSWVTQIAKVLGAIKTIIDFFRTVFASRTSTVEGGDTQQRNESETVEYSSEAAYQAGTASTTSNQATSTWQQTEVWYGDGGCGGGGGGGDMNSGLNYYQAELSTC